MEQRQALRRVAQASAFRNVVRGYRRWAAFLVAQAAIIQVRDIHRKHPPANSDI